MNLISQKYSLIFYFHIIFFWPKPSCFFNIYLASKSWVVELDKLAVRWKTVICLYKNTILFSQPDYREKWSGGFTLPTPLVARPLKKTLFMFVFPKVLEAFWPWPGYGVIGYFIIPRRCSLYCTLSNSRWKTVPCALVRPGSSHGPCSREEYPRTHSGVHYNNTSKNKKRLFQLFKLVYSKFYLTYLYKVRDPFSLHIFKA